MRSHLCHFPRLPLADASACPPAVLNGALAYYFVSPPAVLSPFFFQLSSAAATTASGPCLSSASGTFNTSGGRVLCPPAVVCPASSQIPVPTTGELCCCPPAVRPEPVADRKNRPPAVVALADEDVVRQRYAGGYKPFPTSEPSELRKGEHFEC